jgi:hypothetical protein
VLTDQYLLDLFHLTSNRERVYDWQVMTEGQLQDEPSQNWKPLEQDPARKLLVQPRRWTVDNTPWSVSLQLPDVGASKGAGVRVRMLPEPGTMVQVASTGNGAGRGQQLVGEPPSGQYDVRGVA